jgi:hypothetical protein
MMVVIQISETLVNSYQSTRHNNPEDSHLLVIYSLKGLADAVSSPMFMPEMLAPGQEE